MPDCELALLDDIEDIVKIEDLDREERLSARKHVMPRPYVKRKSQKKDAEYPTEITESAVGGNIIPGTQKIYIQTWGCTHNSSDAEYMAGQLASYGYKIIDDGELADLWLLNSCTVKNPSEDGFKNAISKAQNLGKYVVVAGCVPQGQPNSGFIKGLSVVGVQQIDRVIEVVEETLKGHTVRLFGKKKQNGKKTGGASLDLPKIRKNPLIEIIAINTGCLNQCTYCKTKHARGELGSYPPEDIVARAKQSFQEGVVELWITSEDTGAYGKDIGVTLPFLLRKLVEVIPDGAMLRLGMTNPPYILEHLEEVAKILNHPRVYSFLHVPVQSASNSVLMDMKREYCKEDFIYLVDFLKERVPGITIATDIICGFPTETYEDFKETYQLVDKYKFATLFINQFYPRPGTPAAKMKRLPNNVAKTRTRELAELFYSYLPYEDKLGKRFKILITEDSKDGNHFVGHNKFYDQVLVQKEEGLMGTMVEVEIFETGKHFLKGKIVKDAEIKCPGLTTALQKGEVSGTDIINGKVCSEVETSEQRTSTSSSKRNWLLYAVIILLFAVVVDFCLVLYRMFYS